MKKILSILMLLVAIVTGAKAANVISTADKFCWVNNAVYMANNSTKYWVDDFTMVSSTAYGTTNPTTSNRLKVVADETLTFSAYGKTMSQIVVTWYANTDATLSSGGGSLSNDKKVSTWTGTSTSVTIAKPTAGQIVSVAVTYAETDPAFEATSVNLQDFYKHGVGSGLVFTKSASTPGLAMLSSGGVSEGNVKFAQNGTITINSPVAIKSVVFTWKEGSVPSNALTSDQGTYNTSNYTFTVTNADGEKNIVITNPNGNKYFEELDITFVGSQDPEFSLTKTSIGTNETSQIQVGTKGNLDGIALSNLEYDNTKISIDENGVVTPLVAGGPYSITFTSAAVSGKYNAGSGDLSLTVTAPTYTVSYDLNGGSGTAPTHDPAEAGDKFNLAAAPTKDFSTFAGWLCSADDQVYDAGDEYTMTAAPTTFKAQWTVTTYSSTLDFAAETIKRAVYGSSTAPTGEKAFTNINTFLESGNMIGTSGLNNSNWEPSDQKTGFIGYKLKVSGATVKFMAKAGKKVTITFGRISDKVTLRKNGVASEISANSGEQVQTVVSFDADEDMLVEIVTSSKNTVALNKIAIEDAAASYTVNVGTTGFATVGLPFVTTVPSGVTAYTVSSVSGSTVVLSQEEVGATIPAYKGIIIVAEPGDYTFTEKVVDDTYTGNTGSSSLLATGAVTRNAATTAGEFYYFGIIDSTNRKVGFKKIAVGGTISDHKAYLPGTFVTNNTNSLSLSFEGEATAINGIAEAESDADAPVKVVKNGKLYIGNYNVAGQQVK